MGYLKIKLPDNVENSFRRSAMDRFGYRKGAISSAIQEAIKDWETPRLKFKRISDPVEAISGMLKHVKKTSVDLQHEIGDIISEKYVNRR